MTPVEIGFTGWVWKDHLELWYQELPPFGDVALRVNLHFPLNSCDILELRDLSTLGHIFHWHHPKTYQITDLYDSLHYP